MKKTIFALFAVLLVLSLATCDLLEEPPDARGVVEKGMVRLAVNVVDGSTGRALTTGLGSVAANYYEVVFYDGADYYQTAWVKDGGSGTGGKGEITVQGGHDYGGAANAILFAGTSATDKTLLGVGTLTSVTPPNSTHPTTISMSTTSVTFTVNSLGNDVNDIPSGTQGASTFQITGPTSSSDSDTWDYRTRSVSTTFGSEPIIPRTTGGYAIFRIPGYDTTAPAVYGSASNVTATYSFDVPYNAQVIADGGPTAAVFAQSGVTGETAGTAVAGTITCAATVGSTTQVGSTTTFTTTLNLVIDVTGLGSGENGCYGLLINRPVYPYRTTTAATTTPYVNSEKTTPTPWHIRGGSVLADPDGATTAGNGARVLLAVGTKRPVADGPHTIDINNPTHL